MVRPMAPDEMQSFEEFWPFYVSQHMNPTCRALHVVGTSIGLAHLPFVPVFPPAMVSGLAWGYGLSWVGHFAFEKNKPASWSSPKSALWSFMGDMRMLRRTLNGTMAEDVRAVREQLESGAAEAAAEPGSNGAHATA